MAALVNSIAQLDGIIWLRFDYPNPIARLPYRGDLSCILSSNTFMRFDKVGNVGVWKVGFEWWNLESKIRVREYALVSLFTTKVLAYEEAKFSEDRRSPYVSTTPGARGAGFINVVDGKTLRLSQLGRGSNGVVTLLVYYLERVDFFSDLVMPLTFPSPQN